MRSLLNRGSWFITAPLLGLTAAYVLFIFLPGKKRCDDLRGELKQLQLSITQADADAARTPAVRAELEETRRYVDAWRKRLPRGREVHDLFGRISDAVAQAETTPTHFDPQEAENLERIARVSLNVGCSGDFRQVWKFLHRLDALGEPLWVDRLQVLGGGETGQSLQCETELVLFTHSAGNSD